MNILLAAPTVHNIHSPLRRQFGETEIIVLSEGGTVNISEPNSVVKEIFENVHNLDRTKEYYLLVAGMTLLNLIAFSALVKTFLTVKLLVYDIRLRKYVKISW